MAAIISTLSESCANIGHLLCFLCHEKANLATSEANGMHHHKVLSADGLCRWFASCCNVSLLEET